VNLSPHASQNGETNWAMELAPSRGLVPAPAVAPTGTAHPPRYPKFIGTPTTLVNTLHPKPRSRPDVTPTDDHAEVDGGRWNPWRVLRARPHITLEWAWLRGHRGLWIPHPDGTATIQLDVRLSRRERRCVLAHELVHDERGIAYSRSTPAGLVQAEERWVWAETVRRLVPPDHLADLVHRMLPEPVMVLDVADHFDVDQTVARKACAQLG
jgi:hypothetical protein